MARSTLPKRWWIHADWGLNDSDLALRVGCSREYVRQIRKKLGIEKSPNFNGREHTLTHRFGQIELPQNKTLGELSEITGYHVDSVREHCRVSGFRCADYPKRHQEWSYDETFAKPFRVEVVSPTLGPCVVYGPPRIKKRGAGRPRRYVTVRVGNKETSMLYARFLYQQVHGWTLGSDDSVDHINENPMDDRIENLQVLSRRENTLKSAKHRFGDVGPKFVECACVSCGAAFSRRREWFNTERRRCMTGPYCSRKCVAANMKALIKMGKHRGEVAA